jgi:hypothetical protein
MTALKSSTGLAGSEFENVEKENVMKNDQILISVSPDVKTKKGQLST